MPLDLALECQVHAYQVRLTFRIGVLLCLVTAFALLAAARVEAGPVTFLTALPVAKSQAVVRGQFLLIRATGDPTPADRELTVNGVPLAVAVGLTPRLAIFGIVPIVSKSLDVNTPAGRTTRGAAGLADIVAFARYTIYAVDRADSTFRLAPFGGLKLPTGDDDDVDTLGRLPRSLQLGSGSWDGLAGVALTWQTKQWEVDADAGLRKATEADGFQFGDEFFSDLSLQYRVWPRQLGAGVPAFLFAVIETNLTRQGRSEIANVSDPNSGGTRWDVDVGLQYVTTSYIVEGIVQMPTVDRPNGSGLRNDFRLMAGLRWNLSLPF